MRRAIQWYRALEPDDRDLLVCAVIAVLIVVLVFGWWWE